MPHEPFAVPFQPFSVAAIGPLTRYLWNEVSVRAATNYVLNAQGERMACYPLPDEDQSRSH
jgi:hypothetical protein